MNLRTFLASLGALVALPKALLAARSVSASCPPSLNWPPGTTFLVEAVEHIHAGDMVVSAGVNRDGRPRVRKMRSWFEQPYGVAGASAEAFRWVPVTIVEGSVLR